MCTRTPAGINLILMHVQSGHVRALMPPWSKPLPTGQGPGDKCSPSEVYSNRSLEDPGSFQPSCPQWWPTKQIFSQQPSLLFHFPKPPLLIPDNLRLALGKQALGSSFLNTWGPPPVSGQKSNTSSKQAGLVPFPHASGTKWREEFIWNQGLVTLLDVNAMT